jgi:hypothetical protein
MRIRNPFSKIKPPVCIDCKHHEYGRCKRLITQKWSPVSGYLEQSELDRGCNLERGYEILPDRIYNFLFAKDEIPCGREGRFFEPKEK